MPSAHDSDAQLDETREQYMSVVAHYTEGARRIVERLRLMPINPRSALGVAVAAVAAGAIAPHASVSATLDAAAASAGAHHAPSLASPALESVLASVLAAYPSVPPLLVELACHERPPEVVREAVGAVATLLQWPDTSWAGARAMLLDSTFPLQLASLDLLSVEPAPLERVRRMLAADSPGGVTIAAVRRANEAAAVLLEWATLTVSALGKAHTVALLRRSAAAPVPSAHSHSHAGQYPHQPHALAQTHQPLVFSTPSNLGTSAMAHAASADGHSGGGHAGGGGGNGSPRRRAHHQALPLASVDVAAIAAHMSAAPTAAQQHQHQHHQPQPPQTPYTPTAPRSLKPRVVSVGASPFAASSSAASPSSYSSRLHATKVALGTLSHSAVHAAASAQRAPAPIAVDRTTATLNALNALVTNPKVARESIVMSGPFGSGTPRR